MTDPATPEFDYDENELRFDVDAEPSTMSPDEKLAAAKHTLYEAHRQVTGLKAAIEYAVELLGVTEDEILAIAAKAEADEYAQDEEYEVAESYEDAARRENAT